ncbi:MAG: hypothetical protein NTZ33_12320 [Bacteroidetes bacterium]|nr:hypothetical protein [Bacteroidota bacterium]
MKKILAIFAFIVLYLHINAQQYQYSGYYWQQSNSYDIVLNTAISNFVSNKLLKIDTYEDQYTGSNYFLLTFIDDYFIPVGTSIRYDYPSNARMTINDVKYDADNDCYIACGYNYNNGQGALIICFDNNGIIVWQKSGWDYTNNRGANEYRRVEVCKLPNSTVYAVCGYCWNGVYKLGISAFYDQTGNLLSMYKSQSILSGHYSEYTDIVFNQSNYQLGLTGIHYDQDVPVGVIIQKYDVTTLAPMKTFVRSSYFNSIKAYAIDCDPSTGYYYILGKDRINGELFICKTNFIQIYEKLYPIGQYNLTDIEVTDNCINNSALKLAVTGQCINNNNTKEGFIAEIDINSQLNIAYFSKWSGYQQPYNLPFNDAMFQHIVYRDNMGIYPNYSYILYGLPQNPLSPYSYIAEFYPDYNFQPCSDYLYDTLYTVPQTFFTVNDTLNLAMATDTFPNLNKSYLQLYLQDECEKPNFGLPRGNNQSKFNITLNNSEINFDKVFFNKSCIIYTILGQQIATKKRGESILNIPNIKSGIYLIKTDEDNKIYKLYISK